MDAIADAMDPIAGSGHDPALLPFLETADAAEADRLLAGLLYDRVGRTIRDAVRRVLHAHAAAGRSWLGEDLEDVSSEALARVLRKLRELKADEAREPIRDFDAYAARVAAHACYEHLRRRYPERARLRNRIWYVLTRDPELTIERGTSGSSICGLASGLLDRATHATSVAKLDRRSLPLLVRTLLARRGGAMELNELVDLVAQTLGVRDARPTAADARDPASDLESLTDPAALAPLQALENEQYLMRLWAEVQQLPLRQRTALLLNLRDAAGGDALDLLPRTGTASLRQIAGALSIEAEELARLWPELPLEDRRIAARLGVSRQQVINLRKAARARLSRRMAPGSGRDVRRLGNRGPVPDSSESSGSTPDPA
jgi:RNA polymerase sigma factor (sigma-70 family)